jgi:hypothetical protein
MSVNNRVNLSVSMSVNMSVDMSINMSAEGCEGGSLSLKLPPFRFPQQA